MSKKFFAAIALSMGLLVAAGNAGAANTVKPLAERHLTYGANCLSCHKDGMPKAGAKVKNEQCLACHVSYEVLAQQTAKDEPNPHYNHMGNVRCTDCHSGHAKPRLMCNDCHKFDLKTP